ncbi:hypothetical protein L6Q96_21965 [Candidatus Binatia bacterium]|nr:hypothetical protein [Candidatus Binatia bacterium]
MRDFKGKVAVVDGAAAAIGRAVAERRRRAGMGVVSADIDKPAPAAFPGVAGGWRLRNLDPPAQQE